MMFVLFIPVSFHCGGSDVELERVNDPGWADWYYPQQVCLPDIWRDPGASDRYDWRPQRHVDHAELEGY